MSNLSNETVQGWIAQTKTIIEVKFNEYGNTILGSYSLYRQLDTAMIRKNVFVPYGFKVKAEEADFRRLIEYVELFGHCIKTRKAFAKACELAGVEFVRCAVGERIRQTAVAGATVECCEDTKQEMGTNSTLESVNLSAASL